MACSGSCTRVDWVRARLRALGPAYKGNSSLSTFSAANSCLMVLDDCGATIRRMALTCVWSWARFRGVYGGILVVKRLGNSDSCDVHGQVLMGGHGSGHVRCKYIHLE